MVRHIDTMIEPVSAFAGDPDHEFVKQMDASVSLMKDMTRFIIPTKKIPLYEMRNHFLPVMLQAADVTNVASLLAALQSKDDYLYRHLIGVGVIATLIGKWMGMNEGELSSLSMAALLHDIGKLRIPEEILNRPGKLTVEEQKLMRKHTIFGYKMLIETVGLNHRQMLVALQHHERQDGSGYPFGVGAAKIDIYSRVVAIADIFHALLSHRIYQSAHSFHDSLHQLKQNAFGTLDPQILGVFVHKLMLSLIGNKVVLSDGRIATIVMMNPIDPFYPLVQTDREFIDLSKGVHLKIKQIIASS
ncbi:HD-GYP domain-containing protein [Paenibacillus terrigena]|uniref:HD-GYP domain-containing protein n=1 Tax=Paenibacillus terrigena TaxID=369333 RepID=UPI00037BB9BB|nr:HD-GYP domain-containing protein [Paenibacillus terrigena]